MDFFKEHKLKILLIAIVFAFIGFIWGSTASSSVKEEDLKKQLDDVQFEKSQAYQEIKKLNDLLKQYKEQFGTIEQKSSNSTEEKTGIYDTQSFNLKHGTLLESHSDDNGVLIVKAKISPSYSNKTTIDQNGYNVADLIKNQGADKFNEIQYWAVADMTDGSESKVISFTLNKDLINKIKEGSLVDNKIVDNAQDVWILPSLRK